MKKRILLVVAMLAMLVCLFAITSSATEIDYSDAPTKSNIQVRKDDVVVFKDGFSCPSAYITKDNKHLAQKAGAFDFSYIIGKTGKTYTYEDIVEYDIPQGIETTNDYGLAAHPALKRVSFPDSVKTIGGSMFEKVTTLEKCTFEHSENSSLKEIPNWMFANCTSLKAVSFPDCVTMFTGKHQLGGCTNLKAVYLPKNLLSTNGERNADATFGQCTNMYFVNKPFTFTSDSDIPAKEKIYYFPTNYASIAGEAFDTCKNLNDILVFSANVTSIANHAFENVRTDKGSAKPTIVFLGDTTGIDVNGWSFAAIYFANKNDVDAATAGVANSSGNIYYCNANDNKTHLAEKTVEIPAKCEVNASSVTYCFCGHEMATETKEGTALEHDWVAPTCTADGYCSLCGKAGEKTTGHDYVGVVTEPTCQNGGYTTYTCSVCKDTYTDNKTDAVDHKWNGASCEFNCGATREAYIGNVSYTTLADAIAKANAGDTIVLVADITSSEIIIIDKAITLDLNNSTVTSTAKKVFEVYADVTIKNGTIEGANRCVDTRKAVKLTLDTVALVADKYSSQYGNQQPLTIGGSENGTAVTMNNVTINAGTQGYAIISFVKTELTVNNSDVSGYIALYVKEGSENSTFSFVNSDLTSDITGNDVAGNATAAIKIEASNVAVNLDKDSTLTTNGAYAYAVSINDISSVVVSLPEAYKDALINSGYAVKDNGDGTITAECAHANATVTGYTYASGYNKIGVKVSVCECGETIEEKADALFEAIGYSVPDDGSGEIAVSFKVNGKAIAEFTSVTGKTVSYGVFAVLEERIGENSIFGDNGEIADGVICEELTGYGFTSFDLRITGLETDEYKATAIAMGAYAAISDGEATEYSCMQYGEPEQGASYEFVSYNDVKNNTSQAVNGGV